MADEPKYAGLFAICCTTEISAEAKDHFLKANMDYMLTEDEGIVFVDSTTRPYTRHHVLGHNTPTSPTSPFLGKSPQQCFRLLKQLRKKTKSPVDPHTFAILDDASVQDDTAVLVQIDEEGGVTSARCEFRITSAKLNQYFIGDADLEDDMEEAREDGEEVLRGE